MNPTLEKAFAEKCADLSRYRDKLDSVTALYESLLLAPSYPGRHTRLSIYLHEIYLAEAAVKQARHQWNLVAIEVDRYNSRFPPRKVPVDARKCDPGCWLCSGDRVRHIPPEDRSSGEEKT